MLRLTTSITCSKQRLTVTLERPEIAAEAGLEYATARVEAVTRTLECNAEVAYDGNRHARLAPQVSGVVSSVDREVEGQRYIQLSAQVNPGNSGGPAFDAEGKVIGMATFKLVGLEIEGVSFAIPIERVCSRFDLC